MARWRRASAICRVRSTLSSSTANKSGYAAYYDAVLPMLVDRGLIAVDNVLWSGEVLDPKGEDARAIADFNEKIAKDERVLRVITTIRDGAMLIRKS
jgi:caffeoyl-CoA O-methyltransferase